MKKLLLIALLGTSLQSLISAKAPTTQTKRKKSKEIALIKAVGGSIIAFQNTTGLLNLLIIPTLSPLPKRCLIAPLILSIIGYKVVKQGFDDLDEIAQTE